jgi:hypothetical protein
MQTLQARPQQLALMQNVLSTAPCAFAASSRDDSAIIFLFKAFYSMSGSDL